MKQLYRRGLSETEVLRVAMEALYNAAEEDVGTGGPDLIRGIYPTVKVMTEQGIRDVEPSRIADACATVIEARREKS